MFRYISLLFSTYPLPSHNIHPHTTHTLTVYYTPYLCMCRCMYSAVYSPLSCTLTQHTLTLHTSHIVLPTHAVYITYSIIVSLYSPLSCTPTHPHITHTLTSHTLTYRTTATNDPGGTEGNTGHGGRPQSPTSRDPRGRSTGTAETVGPQAT